MPINFSELVSKVEQSNQLQKQQLVAQIMPAIDLAVQRRNVDYENEQFTQGLNRSLIEQGINDYQIDTSMPRDLQMFNFKRVTGEREAVKLKQAKKEEQDASIVEAVNALGTAYPEVAKEIDEAKKRKPELTPLEQEAIAKKKLSDIGKAEEWEEWKRKANYSASLNGGSGGDGTEPKPLTVTQEQSFQKDVDAVWEKIADATNTGILYTLGGNQYRVRAGKSKSGKLTSSYGEYKYDGKNFTKGTEEPIKKVLIAGYGKAKTLYVALEAARRRQRTAKGIPDTTQPKPQSGNTSQLKQMDKAVQSLIGKY